MISAPGSARVQPLFLDGSGGPLFAINHPPHPGRDSGWGIVYVPPFAEEMNRSRRMAALQARAFAAEGVSVLLLDPYGTGDSGGDFRDARWEIWLADIMTGAAWLERRGVRRFGLWGLRLGGILAAQAAAQSDRFDRLTLWQPVLNGEAMLTQFLRVRIAAALGEASSGETTKDLRQRLAEGEPLEVAGYELAPALCGKIDAARLDRIKPSSSARVDWLEVVVETGGALAPASERIFRSWRDAGIYVNAAIVAGQPFWSIQETTVVPELIDHTIRLFWESSP